ncbi:MAG: NAD(P)/FAD-dependent oxidoreductase [Aestuariivita sp.]|nr:NAD(P)/FAD-dependent oxidoreductase [Aestuariivita sp.]
MTTKASVVVIGGGISGLTATYRLQNLGFRVLLLEQQEQAGGRAQSLELSDFSINLGANHFLESHHTATKFSAEIGVPLRRTPLPIHSGVYRNGRIHGLYGGEKFGNLLRTVYSLLPFRLLSPKGCTELIKLVKMLQLHHADLNRDDCMQGRCFDVGQNVQEFFEQKIGTDALDWLFSPGLLGYCFAQPEKIGAATALTVLWQSGLNGKAWPCLPEGGIDTFVHKLVGFCGKLLRVKARVIGIDLAEDNRWQVVTENQTYTASAVVCATTATEAAKIVSLLPPALRTALERITYSKCCRAFFAMDTSPIPKDWYAIGIPHRVGSILAGISDSAVLAPEIAPERGYVIDALAVDDAADGLFVQENSVVTDRLYSEMRKFFPHMEPVANWSYVHKWPQAMCLSPAGALQSLEEVLENRVNRPSGLFFAGDYLGIPSLNTAIRSGLEAAHSCEQYLSLQYSTGDN